MMEARLWHLYYMDHYIKSMCPARSPRLSKSLPQTPNTNGSAKCLRECLDPQDGFLMLQPYKHSKTLPCTWSSKYGLLPHGMPSLLLSSH